MQPIQGHQKCNAMKLTKNDNNYVQHHVHRRQWVRQSFIYDYANAIFGRIGRIASEEVTLHLIKSKCLPVLLYGLDVCPLNVSDMRSLDFVINRFFMKLFNTNIMDTVKFCQEQFGFELPSVLIVKRKDKFLARYKQFELDHNC